jgi:Crinkler effector protein N-terminal domain
MSSEHTLRTLRLWGLVDGDPAPFLVTIPDSEYTVDLKRAVRKEKSLRVDASSLMLWKVSIF